MLDSESRISVQSSMSDTGLLVLSVRHHAWTKPPHARTRSDPPRIHELHCEVTGKEKESPLFRLSCHCPLSSLRQPILDSCYGWKLNFTSMGISMPGPVPILHWSISCIVRLMGKERNILCFDVYVYVIVESWTTDTGLDWSRGIMDQESWTNQPWQDAFRSSGYG